MLLWIIAASLQCLLLWWLWRGARAILMVKEAETLPQTASSDFSHTASTESSASQAPTPTVAMIIPAAGKNSRMPQALRSLLQQDYPHIIPVIVTATAEDPAHALALELRQEFPQLECVVAGTTQTCGQKNHNTLQGIAHCQHRADIYAFCDSTHTAKPDFIRQLVQPIVNHEVGVTTGYHQVVAKDDTLITLAYQISVLLMRFLQAIATFTQPWGGAMAIDKKTFEHHNIAQFWQDNVVDDCSLASLLMKKRLPVKLCPLALLDTSAQNYTFSLWEAWMQRQVLFLKFCIIPQWYALGIFASLMALPIFISCLLILGGVTNILPFSYGWYTILACIHLAIVTSIILRWREFTPYTAPAMAWIKAFLLACTVLLKVYLTTTKMWHIDWHGIRYYVKKGGKVCRIKKLY